MSDELVRIKRAVLAGNYVFTEKAQSEMDVDGLSEIDVLECIVGASRIDKKLNSTGVRRGHGRERLYVIVNRNLAGVLIYTKEWNRNNFPIGTVRTPLPLREGQGEGRANSLIRRTITQCARPSPNPSLRGRGIGNG